MPGHVTHHPPPATRPIVRALLAWFAANARDLPWRRTRDPYAIWVSEIMLQQTQVTTVIPYWQRWMRALPTLASLAKAPPARLRKLWEGLGYYTRVQHLQQAAKQIIRQHNGKFPQDYQALLALPGIGRYTAGALASIAFNQPKPILDGNVVRVLTRVYGIRANPRQARVNARLWQLAEELVVAAAAMNFPRVRPGARQASSRTRQTAGQNRQTKGRWAPCSALNQSLMELGAIICKPRNPQCDRCPVRKLCVARQHGIAEQLPNTGRRTATQIRHRVVFWVQRQGRLLARQRPANGINACYWELPHIELPDKHADWNQTARKLFAIQPQSNRPLWTVTHHITHHRIRAAVFAGKLLRPSRAFRWLTAAEVRARAFTGLDRKILRQFRLA